MATIGLQQAFRDLRSTRDTPVNIIAILGFVIPFVMSLGLAIASGNPLWALGGALTGFIVAQSPKVVSQWERGILLRLGRYVGCAAPGCSSSCRSSIASPPTSTSAS